jgi:hypothetical protein
MTYINLPPDKINNMTGGAIFDPNNPYLGMDDDELDKHLIEHSIIYLYISKYSWVYWIITVTLFGIAGYFASTQYTIQGIPLLGIEPGITWDVEGMQFLNYFYALSKQKYGLLTSQYSPNINSTAIDNFERDFDEFVLKDGGNSRTAIDTFCNAVAPCNICNCSGPDPNYAGPYKNAPYLNFEGIDSSSGKSCVPKNTTNKPSAADAANAIIKMQASRGVSDLIFGRIPNCCCHLWKALLPNESDFTTTGLQSVLNRLSTITDLNISKSNGCKPANPGNSTPLQQGDGSKVVPHTDANGDSTFVYDMVKGCIENSKLAEVNQGLANFKSGDNVTITALSDKFTFCKDYDLDLDEGISAAHVAKNSRKYITPSIGMTPSGTSVNDVSKSWTSGLWNENGGRPPRITIVKPTDWPSIDPFIGRETINSWWYKSSSNIIYELTIYNRLYEVSAYPVKIRNREIYLDQNEFKSSTYPTIVSFLESYLSVDSLRTKEVFMYGGSYYFP